MNEYRKYYSSPYYYLYLNNILIMISVYEKEIDNKIKVLEKNDGKQIK